MKGKGRVSMRIFLRCHVHTRISLRHTALLLTPVNVTASSSLVALGTVLVVALGVLSTFTSGHLRLPSPAQGERLGRLTLKKEVRVWRGKNGSTSGCQPQVLMPERKQMFKCGF